MKTLEFLYQETEIHFLVNPTDNNVMINATEMAKIFERRTEDFLKTQNTKAFINVMENNIIHPLNRGQIIENRGRNGIYFDRRLAIKFASWLDPEFEFWIYSTIDEILFGKEFSKIQKRMAEIELQKQKIQTLKEKVIESKNTDAINLLEAERDLKQLQSDNRKGIESMKSQVKMNLFETDKN